MPVSICHEIGCGGMKYNTTSIPFNDDSIARGEGTLPIAYRSYIQSLETARTISETPTPTSTPQAATHPLGCRFGLCNCPLCLPATATATTTAPNTQGLQGRQDTQLGSWRSRIRQLSHNPRPKSKSQTKKDEDAKSRKSRFRAMCTQS